MPWWIVISIVYIFVGMVVSRLVGSDVRKKPEGTDGADDALLICIMLFWLPIIVVIFFLLLLAGMAGATLGKKNKDAKQK